MNLQGRLRSCPDGLGDKRTMTKKHENRNHSKMWMNPDAYGLSISQLEKAKYWMGERMNRSERIFRKWICSILDVADTDKPTECKRQKVNSQYKLPQSAYISIFSFHFPSSVQQTPTPVQDVNHAEEAVRRRVGEGLGELSAPPTHLCKFNTALAVQWHRDCAFTAVSQV